LVKEFGSDFTYFKQFFPFKTRRQIQRRYKVISVRDDKLFRQGRERDRKERFDVDILFAKE
jgi:hypothetical protein